MIAVALGGAGAWASRDLISGSRAIAGVEVPAADAAPIIETTRALGTDVSITIVEMDGAAACRAVRAAFGELERIESLLSIYRPDSQISRLNRDGVVDDADSHLLTVLSASLDMARRSGGAFDITVQPLWQLYADAAKLGGLPEATQVDAASHRVNWRAVEVTGRRVRFTGKGMAITLNGIAQGYAADKVRAVLRAHGVRHALVDVGELAPVGKKSNTQSWTAGIQHPRKPDAYVSLARLDGRCLATSGDYATTFSPDRRNNHIFDPATGRSPLEFSSVSVVAPTATEADALSTAVFVLGLEKGAALVRATRGADALFVRKDGSVVVTDGFPQVA
jgi:thiamine biosynthesis lipoprotein